MARCMLRAEELPYLSILSWRDSDPKETDRYLRLRKTDPHERDRMEYISQSWRAKNISTTRQ